MADFFYDGMPNVNERLNQLYAAFSAGPYNALPLTGGTLTGPMSIDTSVANAAATLSLRSGTSANAVLTLSAGGGVSTGAAIVGYRSGVLTYALGHESVVRGGSLSDVVLDCLDNPLKIHSGNSGIPILIVDSAKVSTAQDFLPRTDNARALGSAGLAFSVVYARTGAINTSDGRLKTDFRVLTSAEIAAARDIAREIGVYRWRDAVASKGDGAREHVGPTVQRAIEIMQAHQLDPFGYGFICHDSWERQVVEHPAVEALAAAPDYPGRPAIEARAAYTEVVLEAGDRFAFRYDELAMFIAAGQEARLRVLEGE